MSIESNDGPLLKLLREFGVDANLAPIAAVKRIEEVPVSLNPECLFKMAPTPELMSDTGIHRLELWKDGAVLPAEIPDRMLDARRRKMQFDRVPVGHDTGYRCFDSDKHDAESAFDSGEYGDGMTEDEAYVAWLCTVDEPEPAPRAGYTVHSSPFEPPTVIDTLDRSDEGDE
jgi:hypothetical protein